MKIAFRLDKEDINVTPINGRMLAIEIAEPFALVLMLSEDAAQELAGDIAEWAAWLQDQEGEP